MAIKGRWVYGFVIHNLATTSKAKTHPHALTRLVSFAPLEKTEWTVVVHASTPCARTVLLLTCDASNNYQSDPEYVREYNLSE